jgi:hypothetical protein
MSRNLPRRRVPPSILFVALPLIVCGGCEPERTSASVSAGGIPTAAGALSDSAFAALVTRVSEAGGFFDTDNLISNESGYLKVIGALAREGVRGGAYIGVGPDQNLSYIAHVRPEVAFITDIRRDNLLQHLLLKALIEAAPTRVEFLSALHGVAPPADVGAWADRPAEDLVDWVEGAPGEPAVREALHGRVAEQVAAFGVALDGQDLATIRRFHQVFMDEGPGLRFTSFGRAPRPYYPTYRQLVLETDLEGTPSSYLATSEAYAFVRSLQVANRIVPVVADLSGPHALREIGAVLRETGTPVSAVYTSNVEFYLWGSGTFDRWVANAATLPLSENAVVIRSYFPNFGGSHPSAVPGYYATQTLQPVVSLLRGGFDSYWDVVTRDALPLR